MKSVCRCCFDINIAVYISYPAYFFGRKSPSNGNKAMPRTAPCSVICNSIHL